MNIGELFCGAGGLALGASAAGFQHVWAIDNDRDACDTFSRHFPKTETICGDIAEIERSRLSRVSGIAFGFPCNDFSIVGKQHGLAGQYEKLYEYAVEALECQAPKFFVAENVVGITARGELDEIVEDLSLGNLYNVTVHKMKFEEWAVPQARHRMILVGIRTDLGLPPFSMPEPPFRTISARQALENIPEDAPNHEFSRMSEVVQERLSHIRPGENAFTANLPEHLRLNLRSGATISKIYKRLDPDKPAYTVTASGGGGTKMYHWEELRALTNRERARLQTFPDWFSFCGGRESVRKQIGMAVPQIGARYIFSAVRNHLLGL